MKLIYVDESGNTGAKVDPRQPIHLLGAVIVDEAHVRSIESELQALAEKCLPGALFDERFEFHAVDVCSGRGHFSHMDWPSRLTLLDTLIGVLATYQCRVGYTAINKAKNPSSKSPHELAFMFLVERLEDFLKSTDQRGLIVVDENKEVERDVIRNFARYKTFSTGWGWRPTRIERLIDSVHFVRSSDNHLIQMADLVAYLLLRGKLTRDSLFERFLARPEHPIGLWPQWIEANATEFQKAVLELCSKLSPLQSVAKDYPT